ncbi:metallophosphoesterase family protein [Altererythrobacter lutimaris]|uniref:Metallophosphoesterase n=1 Tax=Altererythrobacter lutimaris TaxID=2743979 RepID=A0A850HDB9_9SPHN|nr:metallophosphoesterase [Altererythrobacter lutimaris]NVE95375.1 metallophosphoesterase [Altererythrobacter lutimaris]
MATRLFHISDVHFGVENRAALDAVARAIHDERPDALVCTGDLTQRATHKQYAAAAVWFEQFDMPVWLDVGNHDMPYYNLWERFSDPFRRFRKLHTAVAVQSFESDDVVLLPLLTTVSAQRRWPWSDGLIRPEALNQALEALRPYRDDPRTIIVTAHHPLHGPQVDGPSDTIGGLAAFPSLAQNGANAVLSGHIHRPFDEDRTIDGSQLQVIGAGTLSTRLRHHAPPSYNVLTCKRGERIKVETRILDRQK